MATPVPVIEVGEASWIQPRRDAYGDAVYLHVNESYIPMAVFFEGFKSTPSCTESIYIWDPGDGSPVTYGGMNFEHVYETDGTFNCTLTILDGTDSATTSYQIIAHDNTGTTYYVDSEIGNDLNDGTSIVTPWQTSKKALAGMRSKKYKPGDRILFKRGQTFYHYNKDFVSAHWQYGPGGYYFGAYGEGPRPIMKYNDTTNGYFFENASYGMVDIGFVDLEFDLKSPTGAFSQVFYSSSSPQDTLFLRCYAHDFYQGISFSTGYGVHIINCIIDNQNNGAGIYLSAHRVAIINNIISDSDVQGIDSHAIYCSFTGACVIRDNIVDQCSWGRHILRISKGYDAYVGYNEFIGYVSTDTNGHWCVIHLAPNTTDEKKIERVVFEYNTITNGDCLLNLGNVFGGVIRRNIISTPETHTKLGLILVGSIHGFDRYGCQDITITENIIEAGPTYSPTGRNLAIGIRDETGLISSLRTGVPRELHTNVKIDNNIIYSDNRGVILASRWAEQRAGLEFTNNLLYKQDGTNIARYSNPESYTYYKTFDELSATFEGDMTGTELITTEYTRPTDFIPVYYDGAELPEQVEVPDMVGVLLATAQSTVVSLGLLVGTVSYEYSESVESGYVISHTPTAGLSVSLNSFVNFVVSQGVEPPTEVEITDMVGMTLAEAQDELTTLGLLLGETTEEYSETIPVGCVISHSPEAGIMVEPYSYVDLVVSLGPDVIIPVIEVNEADWIQPRRDAYPTHLYLLPGVGHAPMGVFFEGWKSTPHAKACTYTWDPGDGSEPVIGGFNFFHVYETPGVYTATLTITDGTDGAFEEVEITVNDNDGTTYYVDAEDGDDTNDGETELTAWKTWNKAVDGLSTRFYTAGDRILFKRGQTFLAYDGDFISVNYQYGFGGYYFGAYGSGDKPIIKWGSDLKGAMFSSKSYGMHKIAFVDLAFDGESSSGFNASPMELNGYPNDILFLRCDFYNHRMGAGGNVSGLFFSECAFSENYFELNREHCHIYHKGERLAICDSTLVDAASHCVYGSSVARGYIRNNTIGPCYKSKCCLRISQGNYQYVADNHFVGVVSEPDSTHWCVLHFAPNTPDDMFTFGMLFEGNIVTNGDCQMNVGCHRNSCFRYNLFEMGKSQSRLGLITIGSLHGYDFYGCEDVEFYGNIVELGDTMPTGHRNAAFYVRDELGLVSSRRTGVARAIHTGVLIHNNLIALEPDEMMLACRWAEQRAEVDFYSNNVYKSSETAIASYANLGNYTALKTFSEFSNTYEGVNTANMLMITPYERPGDFLPDPPEYDPEDPPDGPEDPEDPEDPANPPTEVEITDMVGMTLAEAQDELISLGLLLGETAEEYSETVPVGCVIYHSPVAGIMVEPYSYVNFMLSLGPAPIEVPDLVGLELSAAQDEIVSAGLAVGDIEEEYSAEVEAGYVISQYPEAGVLVEPYSYVDLVVSLGADVIIPVIEVTEADWIQPRRDDYGAGYLPIGVIYAPAGVFFEGWKSVPHAANSIYIWDPGDGSDIVKGGFNFMHVYETPGTYTASLTITSGGSSETAYYTVTVNGPTGTTYYVDAVSGNDANDGKSEGAAWQTFNMAIDGLSTKRYVPGDRILFKRGQTFLVNTGDFASAHWKHGNGGYYFGAYGTGDKPKIKSNSTVRSALINNVSYGWHKISFVDLEFDGYSDLSGLRTSIWNTSSYGNNTTFLRCDFHDHYAAIGGNGYGVFIKDCTFKDALDNYSHYYSSGSRVAFTDSSISGSTNHGAYMSTVKCGVFRNLHFFDQLDSSRTTWRISEGENIYIAHCTVEGFITTDVLSQYQSIHFANNDPGEDKSIHNMLFEYNIVKYGDCQINIGGTFDSTFRYNILSDAVSLQTAGPITFGSLHGYDWYGCDNVDVYGNIIEVPDGSYISDAFWLRTDDCLKLSLRTGVPRELHTNIRIHDNVINIGSTERALACKWAEQRAGLDFTNNTVYRTIDEHFAIFADARGSSTYSKTYVQFMSEFEGDASGTTLNTGTYVRPEIIDIYEEEPTIQVEVPDMVGMLLATAQDALISAGLSVGDIEEAYDEDIEIGYVISHDPEAGTLVDIYSYVDLVVSLGPTPEIQVEVPDMVGMTLEEAQDELTTAGLLTGNVQEEYNEVVPAGEVISHDPSSGTLVDIYSYVDFVVSLGPSPIFVEVPDMVGLDISAAENALIAVGLLVGEIEEVYDEVIPVGQVISHDPAAASSVEIYSYVDFVISKGPNPIPIVEVPDLAGLTLSAAEDALITVGLLVGEITEEYDENVPDGSVISQDPIAGTSVEIYSYVDLVVSKGPIPTVEVPDMVNDLATDAYEEIVLLGLLVGTVDEEYSETIADGNVISHDPVAGSTVEINTYVNFVISKGPEPIEIPDMVNMLATEAYDLVVSLGLLVGDIEEEYSETIDVGYVISHDPEAEEIVTSYSYVDFVVSLGPAPPEEVEVPDVVGLSLSNAYSAITTLGLLIGTTTEQYDETIISGNIISQDPVADTVVLVGTSVDLVVSKGKEPSVEPPEEIIKVIVPDVVGLTLTTATSTIENRSLFVGSVSTVYNATLAESTVVEQYPIQNSRVPVQSYITLVISTKEGEEPPEPEPEMVNVPDIVNMQVGQATVALQNVSLLLGDVDSEYSDTVDQGYIISQSPAAGTTVDVDTTIDIVMSLGPEPDEPEEPEDPELPDSDILKLIQEWFLKIKYGNKKELNNMYKNRLDRIQLLMEALDKLIPDEEDDEE